MDELPARQAMVADPMQRIPANDSIQQLVPAAENLTIATPHPIGARPLPVPAPVIANSTNVAVNVAGPQIIYRPQEGPGLVVRAIWFLFIGWYLGFFWILIAAALNSTIIGLPLGLMMFNAVPKVMTLKSRNTGLSLTTNADGTYTMAHQRPEQYAFWVRAVYFVFVGIWFSIAWAIAAYVIGLMILTLPISFWMFNRMPAITTLARY